MSPQCPLCPDSGRSADIDGGLRSANKRHRAIHSIHGVGACGIADALAITIYRVGARA